MKKSTVDLVVDFFNTYKCPNSFSTLLDTEFSPPTIITLRTGLFFKNDLTAGSKCFFGVSKIGALCNAVKPAAESPSGKFSPLTITTVSQGRLRMYLL